MFELEQYRMKQYTFKEIFRLADGCFYVCRLANSENDIPSAVSRLNFVSVLSTCPFRCHRDRGIRDFGPIETRLGVPCLESRLKNPSSGACRRCSHISISSPLRSKPCPQSATSPVRPRRVWGRTASLLWDTFGVSIDVRLFLTSCGALCDRPQRLVADDPDT